jgi:hypothetical protein
MCTPRAKPMCAPRAEPMCAPRAEPCTPSEAEGWDCYYDAAPMGLVHPERSRVHPERSRGVGLLLWCRPNGAIVPRAEPRGGTVHRILVSASLDEQFISKVEVYTPSETEEALFFPFRSIGAYLI